MLPEYIREVQPKYIGPRVKGPKIQEPQAVVDFIRSRLIDPTIENFVALYLDGAHQVISYSVVSLGLANSTQVHPREVYRCAVLLGACAIIVAHNHPSDDCTPSVDDRRVTMRLKDSAEVLGIKLLDHLVIGNPAFYSFSAHGEL